MATHRQISLEPGERNAPLPHHPGAARGNPAPLPRLTFLGISIDLFNDYGQIFAWWPVPDQELSAVPYETIDSHYGGEMFYIRFATDSGGEQWNVAEAWGITRPGNSGPPSTPPYHSSPLNLLAQGILGSDAAVDKMLKSPPPERPFPPAGGIGWDFAQCHNDHGWSFQNLRARCKADQGLHISPRTADFSLTSPLLTLPAGWSEVIVTMDLRESAAEKAVIQVFWNTEESPGWREEQAYMLNLPTDTDKRSYHFFVFSETPINRLRLDPTNTMGDVVLRRVTVRPIP